MADNSSHAGVTGNPTDDSRTSGFSQEQQGRTGQTSKAAADQECAPVSEAGRKGGERSPYSDDEDSEHSDSSSAPTEAKR